MKNLDQEALEYHSSFPAGKTGIRPVKPTATQHDLAMAYTPGVAAPAEAIAEESDKSYDYTNRGNLIAVISNGTAVLGLGNIGPYAAKPVMEGKALLFKILGGVNAFDIELDVAADFRLEGKAPGDRDIDIAVHDGNRMLDVQGRDGPDKFRADTVAVLDDGAFAYFGNREFDASGVFVELLFEDELLFERSPDLFPVYKVVGSRFNTGYMFFGVVVAVIGV